MCGHTGYKTTSLFFSLNIMYAMEEMKGQKFFAICSMYVKIFDLGTRLHDSKHGSQVWVQLSSSYGLTTTRVCLLGGAKPLQWLSRPALPTNPIHTHIVKVGHQSNLSVTGNIDHKMPVIVALLHFVCICTYCVHQSLHFDFCHTLDLCIHCLPVKSL